MTQNEISDFIFQRRAYTVNNDVRAILSENGACCVRVIYHGHTSRRVFMSVSECRKAAKEWAPYRHAVDITYADGTTETIK